jgi:hypothetical protein
MFISFSVGVIRALTPRSKTPLEGALFLARDQRPGHVAVFCTIGGAFDASPVLVLLTNEEVLDPLTELARE